MSADLLSTSSSAILPVVISVAFVIVLAPALFLCGKLGKFAKRQGLSESGGQLSKKEKSSSFNEVASFQLGGPIRFYKKPIRVNPTDVNVVIESVKKKAMSS
ncbi:unnamed protein product [Soboliphyme baturini]|uniref:Transmembrane protein n=1 Tax=Soboliphyme baturini TaxID=241478 RepID=A0A183J1K4_9BILA|nr:unnamed protein product [Soboliphyme baturini]